MLYCTVRVYTVQYKCTLYSKSYNAGTCFSVPERVAPPCPGGAKFEYLWQDGTKYKKPTHLPAPQYISLLMDWVESQINEYSRGNDDYKSSLDKTQSRNLLFPPPPQGSVDPVAEVSPYGGPGPRPRSRSRVHCIIRGGRGGLGGRIRKQ